MLLSIPEQKGATKTLAFCDTINGFAVPRVQQKTVSLLNNSTQETFP